MEGTVKKAWTEIELSNLFLAARTAGYAAAKACKPIGMRVVEHENPLDDSSPVKQAWDVPEGPCGFAWITIHPGNSRPAKYAARVFDAKPAYGGGMQIWVREFGQSIQLKEAYAEAFAKVLRDAGIKAYGGSRLD